MDQDEVLAAAGCYPFRRRANVVVVVVVVVEEKKLDLFFRVHELMEQEGTNSQTWQR